MDYTHDIQSSKGANNGLGQNCLVRYSSARRRRLVDKFDIHIPFTRVGFVLTLASLVVGTLFVIISWFSNSPQTNKFGATVVYGGLALWVVGVFVYWVVMS